jgi:hypothetical protein
MLLLFRIICAILVAWAMSWALSRPEAAALREELPMFADLAPLAGAVVGFLNLSKRQGWGVIVSVANGLWAGLLSLLLAMLIVVAAAVSEAAGTQVNFDFESLMRVMAEHTAAIMQQLAYLPLVVMAMGATAVVGVVTEIIHWALVRLRKRRPGGQSHYSV